jgi:hypothetical protein
MAADYEPGSDGPVAQRAVAPVASETAAPVASETAAPVAPETAAPVAPETAPPEGVALPVPDAVATAASDDGGGAFDAETIELIAQIRQLAVDDPQGVQQIIAEVLAALDRVTGTTLQQP